MPDHILLEREGAVRIVVLNRPDKRNAMGQEMRRALVELFDQIEGDATCSAVVVTGAGGHFCAGGDLSSTPIGSAIAAHSRLRDAQGLLLRIVQSRKPYIAAVEGAAYGAGLSLAIACDHVVATPESRFCAPFVRVGLAPDVGLLWTLPRRVGSGRASDIMLGAEPLIGEEAVRIGLADRLVPAGQAREAAIRRAGIYAMGAPAALAATKSGLLHSGGPLSAALEFEAMAQAVLLGTADHAEGKAAFFERRRAEFGNH